MRIAQELLQLAHDQAFESQLMPWERTGTNLVVIVSEKTQTDIYKDGDVQPDASVAHFRAVRVRSIDQWGAEFEDAEGRTLRVKGYDFTVAPVEIESPETSQPEA